MSKSEMKRQVTLGRDYEAEIKVLKQKLSVCKEALEFYGDENTYKPENWAALTNIIDNDKGNKAREVLKKLEVK